MHVGARRGGAGAPRPRRDDGTLRRSEAARAEARRRGTEGPFAEALAALAAARAGAATSAQPLEAALTVLTKMDAQYMLAYALNAAAEIDLSAQRWATFVEVEDVGAVPPRVPGAVLASLCAGS